MSTQNAIAPTLQRATELSDWCFSGGKRWMDMLVSTVALVISAPLLACVALAVKFSSPGPILFRQQRLGAGGSEFYLLKFRTMYDSAGRPGLGLTARGDRRITRIGAMLRTSKLDELPQLFNVLRGEMTLVGPRPDLPRYMDSLQDSRKQVLLLTPGVTGPASLQYHDEESLLASVPPGQLEQFYVTELLPRKVALDLEYARQASMLGDLHILLRTFLAILPRTSKNSN
jgi:lipopolysaccharide/colanic/teichoic acid biosynthesis glycosyltransferase